MIDKNLAVTFPQGFLIGQKNMGSASSPNPCGFMICILF